MKSSEAYLISSRTFEGYQICTNVAYDLEDLMMIHKQNKTKLNIHLL